MPLLHSSKWWFTQKPYEDETFNVSGGFSCCSHFEMYMKSLIRKNLVPFNQTNPNKENTISKYQFEEEENNNNDAFIENRTTKLLMFIFLCTNMLSSVASHCVIEHPRYVVLKWSKFIYWMTLFMQHMPKETRQVVCWKTKRKWAATKPELEIKSSFRLQVESSFETFFFSVLKL